MVGNVILPFFGADPLPWVRPGLSIAGSGNNFTSWLNKDPGLVAVIDDQGTPGINYTVNDVLTVVGGVSSTSGQITVDSVDDITGAITGFHISRAGSYSVPPSTDGSPSAFSGGTGTDAVFSCVILVPISATDGADGRPLVIGAVDVVGTERETIGVLRGLCKNAPGAPFVFSAGVALPHFAKVSNVFASLFLVDTNAQKAVNFGWGTGYFAVHHVDLSNNSLTKVMDINSVFDYFLWMRILHDGTDIKLQFSSQNINYLTIYSESKTAYLTTIDKIGFGIMTNGGNTPGQVNGQALVDLWNWVEA